MDWHCQNHECRIQNWRKKWQTMPLKVNHFLILDITATYKEFSPKNHGLDPRNWNSSNSTVKLEINGPELLRKCQREVTTTSKIIFIPNSEELLGKSTSSSLRSSIKKRSKSNSTTSIWLWKFLKPSLEEIVNGRTINQTPPRTSKIDFSSLHLTKTKPPNSKHKKTFF